MTGASGSNQGSAQDDMPFAFTYNGSGGVSSGTEAVTTASERNHLGLPSSDSNPSVAQMAMPFNPFAQGHTDSDIEAM